MESLIKTTKTDIKGQTYAEIPASKTLDVTQNKVSTSYVLAQLAAIVSAGTLGAAQGIATATIAAVNAYGEQGIFTQYTVPTAKTLKVSINITGREEA